MREHGYRGFHISVLAAAATVAAALLSVFPAGAGAQAAETDLLISGADLLSSEADLPATETDLLTSETDLLTTQADQAAAAADSLTTGMDLLSSDLSDSAEDAAGAGYYYSELTGEPIRADIREQRPIAVMIDNDQAALPHYNLSEADIVYEMVNSTANNRITRLMAVYKDWGDLEMTGNIRSVRPTNILLAQEWEAVICHDGGPYYIDDYFSRYPYSFSATFSRVKNGKAYEFTEYILPGDLERNFASTGYSTVYSVPQEEQEPHYTFAEYAGEEISLSGQSGAVSAQSISLPFYNTDSTLQYNTETGTYDYYEFGRLITDGQTGETVTFKNVFVLDCTFHEYDSNGYLIYNCITEGEAGWYCTNGMAIPIMWNKLDESGYTHYYDMYGQEITINTGKTYISLVMEDTWDEVLLN